MTSPDLDPATTPSPDGATADSSAAMLRATAGALSGLAAGWVVARSVRRRRALTDLGPQDSLPASDALPAARDAAAGQSDAASSATQAPILAEPAVSGGAPWSTTTKLVAALALAAFALVVLYWSRSVIPMLVTAALIAFVMRPFIGWLQARLKLSQRVATIVAYILIVLGILTIPLLIIPTLWDGVNQVQAQDFAPVVTASQAVLEAVQRWLQGLPVVGSQLSAIFQPLDDFLRSVEQGRVSQWLAPAAAAGGVDLGAVSLGTVTGVISPVVRWLLTAAFTILISLYLTTGRYSLRRFILTNAPPGSQAELTTLFERIAWTWNSFLLGQLKLMFFIGFVVFLGNLLLGNRYAPLLGLISGVFELIPNLGAILGLIPGVVVALVFGSSWMGVNNAVFAIIILIMYVVIQLFENQIIVPRVLGDAVELPPLVVLIGVLVGGTQAGILGALIAVPVIGTAREVISYVYGKIIESPALESPPPIETGLVGRLTSSAQSLAARLFGPAGSRKS